MSKACIIVSWNVRGLGDGVKRVALFSMVKAYKPSVICLQETHLRDNSISMHKNRDYPTQFHSIHMAYLRGVSTLISRAANFQLLHSLIGNQGWYIFLLCKITGLTCIIANIYVPPPFSFDSLKQLSQFMATNPNVPVWVLGEYNNVMYKKLDKFLSRTGSAPQLSGPAPFARFLMEIGLRDVRRDQNPTRASQHHTNAYPV